MRRVIFGIALLVPFVVASAAIAQTSSSFTIEVEGIATGDEGEVIVVAQESVDPDLVGATCNVRSRTQNNSSVHPGNDAIIRTNGSTAVIEGIEEFPGEVIELDSTVVLGETVTVSLRFGPTGITSAGFRLIFDCAQPEPTTTTTTTQAPTTTEAPTTTVAPTTTAAPTTTLAPSTSVSQTTEPPPEGGVSAGMGGTADSGSSGLLVVGLGLAALAAGGGALAWKRWSEER